LVAGTGESFLSNLQRCQNKGARDCGDKPEHQIDIASIRQAQALLDKAKQIQAA
jgi:hypothetical protein